MSFIQDNSTYTGLVPNQLLALSNTGDNGIEVGANGINLGTNLNTTPNNILINGNGFQQTTGSGYSVSFQNLYNAKQALQAVNVPPNATTFSVSDTILIQNGSNSLTLDENNILHNATVGNDLSISSNQNLTISADNIDIGATEIIYPTLATPANTRINSAGRITINNNGGGSTPLVSLNQVSATGGILTEEVYNQRTGVVGEFARQSFYAKTNTGAKAEFARINQNSQVLTTGAIKGRIDFSVGNGAGLSNYFSLNANTGQVDINNSTLHLNNNNISNVNTISTPVSNYYAKQVAPVFLHAHTNITNNIEDNARYNAFNAGRYATWEQATSIGDFSGTVENITASQYGFNSYWWVGTSIGNVYYSTDSGATWNFVYNFGGRINCFQTYNSGSSMMIGGQFTGTYNYIASIDTSLAITDPTGFAGLNSEVNCIYEDTAHSVLLIGGAFTAFYGSSGTFLGFVAYSWGSASWYSLNNTTGAGFTGGAVKSITFDSGNNFVIVGGDFTDENITGSNLGIPYLFTFITPDGYTVSSYFSVGFTLSNVVSSVLMYSGEVMVGGQFTNSAGQGSCTTNYGFKMNWGGSSWNLTDYPIYQPQNYISSITYNANTGVYYTIEQGNIIYSGATQLPTPMPTGSSWNCIAYNGSSTYFATDNQTGVGFLFYQLNNSLAINISSIGASFITYSGSYNNCVLLGYGSSVEMMYYNGSWWCISQNGSIFN